MVRIVPLSENEKEMLKQRGQQARVSGEIIKDFENSGLDVAKVDYPEKDPTMLAATLRYFIKAHNLPYRISVRRGNLYIMKAKEKKQAPKLDESVVDERI